MARRAPFMCAGPPLAATVIPRPRGLPRVPRMSSIHFKRSPLSRVPGLCGLGLLLLSSTTHAAEAPDAAAPGTRIEVTAAPLAPRDAKTLGDLARARQMFLEHRALAPQAELRIRVLARLDRAQADRLALQLQAPSGRIDVALDGLSRFVIDPAWDGLPEDTVVRSRLRDGSVTWRSDVRTPGLPPNVRRLGDLRLQCKIDWGSPLARRGLVPSLSRVVGDGALCRSRFTGALNSQFADRPVLAIDLVDGPRRERLSYFFLHGAGDHAITLAASGSLDWFHDLRDHMYRLPLHDDSWPDDALVEFVFMDTRTVSLEREGP